MGNQPGLVILIGMGVVFAGLILLIIAITIMNGLLKLFDRKRPQETVNEQKTAVESDIDHNELIAVIAASIATEMNTPVKGLRITSVKRI